MIMGHWFTTIGMSPHAVFNTLWAAYLEHDWYPSKITVFRLTPSASKLGIKERLDSSYRTFETWHQRFTERHNLKTELAAIPCDEEDYATYAKIYRMALRSSANIP